jgi:hypothetical protein
MQARNKLLVSVAYKDFCYCSKTYPILTNADPVHDGCSLATDSLHKNIATVLMEHLICWGTLM